MTKLHDFLIEHAKFPFPPPNEDCSLGTADISNFEVGLLEREWKATHAIQDSNLIQKLCNGLKLITGDTTLEPDCQDALLSDFSPRIERFHEGLWSRNSCEADSRIFLDKGIYPAASVCLSAYGNYRCMVIKEVAHSGRSSKADDTILVDNIARVLCEVESPSTMKKFGELLPPSGTELAWVQGQPLLQKILLKAALYLGLSKLEWLFLTCYNQWVVCRLVRDGNHTFLAYSPKISIESSSEPFRAVLGAILSAVTGTSVESSTIKLDSIVTESNGSGGDLTMMDSHRNADSGLMISSSSPNSPQSSQIWVHLRALSKNTPAFPVSNNGQQRLWLTHFLGHGSTGNVWKCRFDNSDDSFAIKIVELLRSSDIDRQQRLRNEFNVYLTLEEAYKSGELQARITPRFYGAFEGDGVDVLVLDLCEGVLKEWDELSDSERTQVYRLAQQLHKVGIAHGDLEPRNVMRVRGGGFCLIDFSESRKHSCEGEMPRKPRTSRSTAVKNGSCYELQQLRSSLWRRCLLQPYSIN